VAIARPLLANPDLLKQFQEDPPLNEPRNPCTFCSLCCARTAVFPLGCYDVSRFNGSQEAMLDEILRISSPERPGDTVAAEERPLR
jgi:2,4-dienoyl-CoA reductase (NADPH2)